MIKKNCLICNKEFEITNNRIKTAKYCSRICHNKSLLDIKGKNHPLYKEKIKCICKICGKEFYVFPRTIKYKQGKFCSRKCYGKWLSQNKCGKNNPLWKNGITSIVGLIRKSIKYKQWRQDVFIHDNFTCQKCGVKSGNGKAVYLEAHHKTPFNKLIEEVKKYLPLLPLYEGAMTYTPLWEINNGITLCKKCHQKTKKGRSKRI